MVVICLRLSPLTCVFFFFLSSPVRGSQYSPHWLQVCVCHTPLCYGMGRGCCYADTRKICTAYETKEIRSSLPRAAVCFFLFFTSCSCWFNRPHCCFLEYFFCCLYHVMCFGLALCRTGRRKSSSETIMMLIKDGSSPLPTCVKWRALDTVCCSKSVCSTE